MSRQAYNLSPYLLCRTDEKTLLQICKPGLRSISVDCDFSATISQSVYKDANICYNSRYGFLIFCLC